MIKSFWPLWLLAGALTLCIVGIGWLHFEVRDQAASMATLQSANEANAKTITALVDGQQKQDAALTRWEDRQQTLTKASKAKTTMVREAVKNADFKTWADQPLPLDARRVLQGSGLAH